MPDAPDDLIGHYDRYWENVDGSYRHYPTIRHRKRYVLGRIGDRAAREGAPSVFDFGCGDGSLLEAIQRTWNLPADRVGGNDISPGAVEMARRRVNSPHLRVGEFPDLDRTFDVVVCSEVLEHTPRYLDTLRWIYRALSPGGEAILTTQAGRIHASDLYTGHTQHFSLASLKRALRDIGFEVVHARLWGFPLFTAQKYLTDVRFEHVRTAYLEGGLSLRKRIAFSLAYALYFLHDLIPYGPQIYIVVRRPRTASI